MDVKEINIDNEAYPKQLRHIENPPRKLYVLGNEKLLNTQCLSIIGSRCCTDNGKEIARNFAKKIALMRNYYCKWNGERNR